MNQRIKDNWVAALVSGEYEQCKNRLHIDNGFCCLGVLTDLYIKAHEGLDEGHWEVSTKHRQTFPGAMVFSPTGDYSLLPDAVVDWAGLDTDSPRVGSFQLSGLNDSGTSFKDIAQRIKESDL